MRLPRSLSILYGIYHCHLLALDAALFDPPVLLLHASDDVSTVLPGNRLSSLLACFHLLTPRVQLRNCTSLVALSSGSMSSDWPSPPTGLEPDRATYIGCFARKLSLQGELACPGRMDT